MRRAVTSLLIFAWLLCVAYYYSQHRGSFSVLFLLGFVLVLFVLSVIDYRLNMRGQLQQVPLSLCFRRRWDWRFMFVTKAGLAPMQTTDCANYLAEAKKKCSVSDGSQASTQTIGNESNETGLGQLSWDNRTSTITESTEKHAEPERTECKPVTKHSATSERSKRYDLVLVCFLALLYIFPVAVLLEIKDTTTRTESEVDHIAVKLTSGLSPAMADRILAKVNSR